MCGIIISLTPELQGEIRHRGIEYSGVERHNRFYGHHRLPIQTVKGDGWNQPIELAGGGLLLYNGEIFNYDYTRYSSDVEYLKASIETQGPYKTIHDSQQWDGFWTIVVVEPDGKMIVWTDPLGKKQLYYNNFNEICSEITPLIRGPRDFDQLYRSQVLKWGYHVGNRTPWNHVKRILPNRVYSFLTNNEVKVSSEDYFSWGYPHMGRGRIPLAYDLENLMYRAVKDRIHTVKMYGVGCLLSGGLDSSIIAHLSHQIDPGVGFYYVDNDEGEYAQEMAQYMGVELHALGYNPWADINTILKWNETPVDLGSVVPQHNLMKAVKERVILTGDGADELFGGYSRSFEYDSQRSDIFDELTYYHLPRLDRASMRYTVELRNPFLSHNVVKYALHMNRRDRVGKKILKDVFGRYLPKSIVDRPKLALRNPDLAMNYSPEGKMDYRKKLDKIFYNDISWTKPKNMD